MKELRHDLINYDRPDVVQNLVTIRITTILVMLGLPVAGWHADDVLGNRGVENWLPALGIGKNGDVYVMPCGFWTTIFATLAKVFHVLRPCPAVRERLLTALGWRNLVRHQLII